MNTRTNKKKITGNISIMTTEKHSYNTKYLFSRLLWGVGRGVTESSLSQIDRIWGEVLATSLRGISDGRSIHGWFDSTGSDSIKTLWLQLEFLLLFETFLYIKVKLRNNNTSRITFALCDKNVKQH